MSITYSELLKWEREQILHDGYGKDPATELTMGQQKGLIHKKTKFPAGIKVIEADHKFTTAIRTAAGRAKIGTVMPWLVEYEGERGVLFPRPMARITQTSGGVMTWDREVMWAAYLQNRRPDLLGTRRWVWVSGTGKTNQNKGYVQALPDYGPWALKGVMEITRDVVNRIIKAKRKSA